MFKLEHVILTAALAATAGCATAPMPYKAPVSATPPTGTVVVSQAVNVLDSSGSLETAFADGSLQRTPLLSQFVADLAQALEQDGGGKLGGKSAEAARFILRAIDRELDQA